MAKTVKLLKKNPYHALIVHNLKSTLFGQIDKRIYVSLKI